MLSEVPEIVPPVAHEDAGHVYHLYVVRLSDRDAVLEKLSARGIGAGVHYPIPLHEQAAYRYLDLEPDALSVTHKTAETVLSLPMFPELTRGQAERVANSLCDIVTVARGAG